MTIGPGGLVEHLLRGLEDALGSVERPGAAPPRPWACTSTPGTSTARPTTVRSTAQLGSFTLGPDATSPLDLASAYSTVAASGTHCDPTPVTAILDQNGQPLKNAKGQAIDTGDHCTPNAIAPGRRQHAGQHDGRRRRPRPAPAARRIIPGHRSAARPAPPRTTRRRPSAASRPTTR